MAGHTQHRCKHLSCGLHFVILTWHPERHTADNLTCPECGKKDGLFQIFTAQVPEQIFTVVPGSGAELKSLPDIRQLLSGLAAKDE